MGGAMRATAFKRSGPINPIGPTKAAAREDATRRVAAQALRQFAQDKRAGSAPTNQRRKPQNFQKAEALRYTRQPTLRAFFNLRCRSRRGREGWGTRKSKTKQQISRTVS